MKNAIYSLSATSYFTRHARSLRFKILVLMLAIQSLNWIDSAKAQCADFWIGVDRVDGGDSSHVITTGGRLYPNGTFIITGEHWSTLGGLSAFVQIGGYYVAFTWESLPDYQTLYPWANFTHGGGCGPSTYCQWRVQGWGPNACGGGGTPTPTPPGACAGEIVVEQPVGNSLIDNSATPVVFANTTVGSDRSLTFTIRNTSTAQSLTVGAVTKDGENAGDFTITQNPINNGNGGLDFVARFAPSGPGTRTATLHIANSDCDENPFDIRLSGVGQSAEVFYTVSPSAGPNGVITPSTVQTVSSGGSVSFGVVVSTGYVVDQWRVDGVVVQTGGNILTLHNVTANKTVQATFKTANSNCGLTTLVSFNSTNGRSPVAGLVQGSDGNFYGTTSFGGANNGGTVFKLTPSGTLTTLVSFNGVNGRVPVGELTGGSNGIFYGTTLFGGVNDYGTVFRITSAGALTTLVSLNSTNGSYPKSGLIQGSDGNFYGTTDRGGANNYGTVFKVTSAGALTTLVSFNSTSGRYSSARLIQLSDGNFYGTTYQGGANNYGTVFKVTPTGTLMTLVSFTSANGESPLAELVLGSSGSLYGSTHEGGANDYGTVFRITSAGTLTTLVSFNGVNGRDPVAGVIEGGDGNFYGTTRAGGAGDGGTVFKMTPTGALTTLVNFSPNGDGTAPNARLIKASDGNFYGTTRDGGANDYGTVFKLNLECMPSTTLANISTRLRVETGDNTLIGGFIVTGTQPKRMIVRAIGPSLSSFFPGTLADPVLELRNSSGGLISSNDNWRSDQQTEIMATGLAPSNDLESSIMATLPANNSGYTAIVRGLNNGTGIGLVEAYDLDQTVDSKLANISTRGLVQTGDNVLIGGFILSGGGGTNVLVRAIGPTLAQVGVNGALQDPTLELYDASGTRVALNDDWRSDQLPEIMITTLQPTNDRESAILRTLSPGNYTAIVRGKADTTGVALVEAYQLQ